MLSRNNSLYSKKRKTYKKIKHIRRVRKRNQSKQFYGVEHPLPPLLIEKY